MTTLYRLVLDHDKGCEICALQLLCRLIVKEDIVQLISHDPKSKFPDVLDHFENFTEEIKVNVVKMVRFQILCFIIGPIATLINLILKKH